MNHRVEIIEMEGARRKPSLAARPRMPLLLQAVDLAGRTPCISAGVFFDSPKAEDALNDALRDRRLSRITPFVSKGGLDAAIAYYSTAPTPDLLVLETMADADDILAGLDRLSGVCDASTKVILIGALNDIRLYRAIIAKGVSDYLVAPVDSLSAIAAVLGLYKSETAKRLGKVCAFVGAKGGVGASTLAQNVAWRIGEDRSGPVMLADLDLQFGTAALNLNLAPSAGFAEQATDPDRLDEALLERTLIQKGKHLHVLPASGRMQEIESPNPVAVEKLLDLARQSFPIVVLDLPHLQSPWMKSALAEADDLVIVATPDLVAMRNAKFLYETFRALRPNDAPPRVVLNQFGIAKRAGVSSKDFANGLQIKIAAQIAFDPQAFGKAAGDGRLLTEAAPRCSVSRAISALAKDIGLRQPLGGSPAAQKQHWLRKLW